MACFVAFGEIMARMAPAGFLRMPQVLPGSLDVTFAGAEANVAASLAMLGSPVRFVTALPKTPLADACVVNLRGQGVDTRFVRRTDSGRMGIYFVENGANQRPCRVTYDREHTAISLAGPGDFDWQAIFHNAHWLHITSITAALSQSAAETTLEAVRQARAAGVRISLDVNFRSKLWRWDPRSTPAELAGQVLRKLVPLVDMLMANEEDCRLLGITLPDDRPRTGSARDQAIQDVRLLAGKTVQQYPNLKQFVTTLREGLSASHNNWGAALFDKATDEVVCAPVRDGQYEPYEIRNIVDRVGAGDAFAAGLLFALHSDEYPSLSAALEFATAASCLAHSVVGDTNFASQAEIDELVGGSGTGRVVR